MVMTPVPVFHTQQLNPDPSVAAAVNDTVNVPLVQLIIVPRSPETTVYAAVLLLIVSADDPPPPEAAIVIEPGPLVIVMFDPAVSVAFASVPPVVLPISSWPSV